MNFRTKGAITIAAGFAAVAISQIMIGQNFDVRNLYNHTGIHPGVAASTVLFLAGGYFLVSGLMKSSKSGRLRLWWLVLQELGARPFRSLTMGAGIAVVVGVIFLSFLVTAGAATSANIASGKAGADIMVVAEGTAIQNDFYRYPFSYSSLLSGSIQEQIASIEGVESVSGQRFLGTVLTGTGGCG
ncbi:MAG: hypothetical protein ACE5KO_06970, partial [Candidatus Bathyarchaeia archaeon]